MPLGGWDSAVPYNNEEPTGAGQQWDEQLQSLQQQWPDMVKQREDRAREIAVRTTERQLHTTTDMLDSWTPLAASTGRPHPPAPLQLDHSAYTSHRSSQDYSDGSQAWHGDGWQSRRESVDNGLRNASGLVATTLSPTEPNHPQLHRNASISSASSYRAPYSPYPLPQPPLHNFGNHAPAPNGHWDPQAQSQGHPKPLYQRSDSYQSDSSHPPTSIHSPYESPYPSPYLFEHGHHPLMPGNMGAIPPPSHYFAPPPNAFPVDEHGRPLGLPWPQAGHPPHPQSFYNQSQAFPLPPLSMQPHYNYGQQPPVYKAYSIAPHGYYSNSSQEPSPQDSRHSGPSPQASSAVDSIAAATTSLATDSPSPLAPELSLPEITTASVSAAAPVDFAASNELLLAKPGPKQSTSKRTRVVKPGNDKVTTSNDKSERRPSTATTQPRAPRKGSKRVTADLMIDCESCDKSLARLILRGQQDDINVRHYPSFKCMACDSADPPAPADDAEATYQSNPAPSRAPKSAFTSFRKRHKRPDTQSAVNACDVCLRDIAVGAVVAEDQQDRIEFQIEVVCTTCDERYRRCSDCGGGGGQRLGVGKWRSKELFVGDRKTCSLPHVRLGALSDMFYDVHSVTEIPSDEVDEIAEICGTIFSNTLYSGICIPEVFEHQSAIAKDFAGVQVMASRGWGAISPMIKVDIEKQRNIRRYLALRSCTPNPRKGSQPAPPVPAEANRVILRPKKDVVGFIVAEWDMPAGCLFLAVVVPWQALGEVFDATTILIQALFQRIEEDRRSLNTDRAAAGLPPLPSVDLVWTMMFFQKDSRMIGHLEKKRGFSHLPDFLKANSDISPNTFPPLRPCYLPVERQEGWQVMVRRRQGPSDDFFTIRRTSTSQDIEKKRKEKKARARREEEAAAEAE